MNSGENGHGENSTAQRSPVVKMLSGLNAFGISNIHGGDFKVRFVVGKQCNNVTYR